jgi:hypothetical protein
VDWNSASLRILEPLPARGADNLGRELRLVMVDSLRGRLAGILDFVRATLSVGIALGAVVLPARLDMGILGIGFVFDIAEVVPKVDLALVLAGDLKSKLDALEDIS